APAEPAAAARPALCRPAAGRGPRARREPAVGGAVLADLRPAGALPHGQGKGQYPPRRVARRLLRSEAEMAEGSPQAIVERGSGALPPALLLQGTGDDNVTPDMADRFAAAWRARGGVLELHKFAGQPHTFVVRDPTSEASRHACELARDFILAR